MHYADCGIYDTGYDPYSGDTAFLGKLVKKIGRAVSRPVASIGRQIGRTGYGIGKGFVGAAKGIAPIAASALPYIQQGMKLAGPMGMVASGAAGALGAVVQGKSLENIAWAAAEGASPPGIDRAVAAAKALREGKPVLQVAISQARAAMPGGSAAQRAFDLGVATVKGGSKGMMANARNQLRTAVEKAAYDSAVGTIAKASGHLPSLGRGPRISFVQPRPRMAMSLLRPATQTAVHIFRRQPSLFRMQDRDIASRFGLPLRRVMEARGIVEASGVVEVGDTPEVLGTYIIKSGDTGSGLAKRFTGDSNRWRELPKYNKRGMGGYAGSKDMVVKQTTTTIGGKKVPVTLLDPFYSGLKINMPPGWAGPGITNVEIIPEVVITPGPTPTPIPQPVPTPFPQLPPSIPVGTPPPVVVTPPITTPPIVTPPITTPTVTTPPITMPEPFPSIPSQTIPGQTIPGQTIPSQTIPGQTIPIGTGPGPSVPSPTPTLPSVPGVPATPEQKKKDSTAAAVALAAAAAFMFL